MATTKVDYPLILVNLKTYREAMGDKAMKLAAAAEKVHDQTGVCVAIAPQTSYLASVAGVTSAPVFAQHVDAVGFGKYTGHILPEAVVEAGCAGTLISHSEKRLEIREIEETVKRAREAGLHQVVCVDTIERGRAVAPFNPDAIAIEPPELIGTGIPVSKSRPEVVSGSVEAVQGLNPDIKVLCGAGITSGEDVAAAVRLGAAGVLVASGVVKAPDPFKKLIELSSAVSTVT